MPTSLFRQSLKLVEMMTDSAISLYAWLGPRVLMWPVGTSAPIDVGVNVLSLICFTKHWVRNLRDMVQEEVDISWVSINKRRHQHNNKTLR